MWGLLRLKVGSPELGGYANSILLLSESIGFGRSQFPVCKPEPPVLLVSWALARTHFSTELPQDGVKLDHHVAAYRLPVGNFGRASDSPSLFLIRRNRTGEPAFSSDSMNPSKEGKGIPREHPLPLAGADRVLGGCGTIFTTD